MVLNWIIQHLKAERDVLAAAIECLEQLAALAVSLKARLCAWMDGQVRESVHVYATCEVGESESPVAEGDGLSPYYVSTAGARRQNRHRSSSTLGPSGIQTPLYCPSNCLASSPPTKASFSGVSKLFRSAISISCSKSGPFSLYTSTSRRSFNRSKDCRLPAPQEP